MQQYPLPLALDTVYSSDNFAASASNELALKFVAAWPDWPSYGLVIYGPPGSGKTHLAHIWAARARAVFLDVTQLAPDTHAPAIVIEHIEKLRDEAALFHLLNSCKNDQRPLLLTANDAPSRLGFKLPDLISRLNALAGARIEAPDDAALSAVLRKQFADRQLKIEDEVIQYILVRLPRSFDSAKEWVERLDSQALANKKTITIPFVRQVLGKELTGTSNY